MSCQLIRVSAKEYGQIFSHPNHVFNSAAFSELNKDKCDDLHYLIFKESKIKLGIVLGERENSFRSPFSAPFGGFSCNREVEIGFYEEAVRCLEQYAKENDRRIKISIPPYIYGDSHVGKSFSALSRSDFRLLYTDVNYHYDLSNFPNYEERLNSGTRNKFRNSLKYDFDFQKLNDRDETDVSRAYSVIRTNRESRGFPLRMSLQSVLDTVKVVKADFFVMSYEGVDVAAAQVFHVSNDVYQVIYWGDVPEYASMRVMNFFSYKVFEYYHSHGLRLLDIGPSTENGIPNYGLCDFKENIGCDISLKFTFEL